jgi:hypothetical protein
LSHKTKLVEDFFGLGLKTGSYGLVILASKSPRRFLGLGLKIKWATVCRFHHKIDGRVMVWVTCRDIAACFTWKQVGLGFPSLASRLADARRQVVHVPPSRRLHLDQVKDRRVVAMGYVGPCYSCSVVFVLLCHRAVVVF